MLQQILPLPGREARAAGKGAGGLGKITIHLTPLPRKIFLPAHAFGAGIDGSETGTVARVFRPGTLDAMRSMHLRPLTYRLRTELGVEAWHWNPRGVWSNRVRREGYFTGDAKAHSGPVNVSWGYRLPRRGSTIDQANNDGYSRIDDGDSATFWKSNPYLDAHFTHESNALHPQWVVVDLGANRPVDAIRLRWGVSYATRYRVEYTVFPPKVAVSGSESAFEPEIDWRAFPGGIVGDGKGGDVTLALSPQLMVTRFVRVWMTASGPIRPCRDVRDGLGYALRELSVGVRKGKKFTDFVRHKPSHDEQSVVYVSSTDPYHRSGDRDPRVEQPGFDLVARSGLIGGGEPMLTPVSILYGTPEDAVAELRYLRARRIPVRQMELGEEPDGQYMMPEDYGALYIQWADALHHVDPTLKLGGPSFQTSVDGWVQWADAHGDTSWLRRFLAYLTTHGHRADFAFFSFEWYPFDDVAAPPERQLARHAKMLDASIEGLLADGLPRDIPWIISEYGYSSFATDAEVTLPGAITNAETVARFLTLGGDQAYLYGYEPGGLNHESGTPGATWGDVLALLSGKDEKPLARLPTYWTARLLTECWTGDPHLPHELFDATVTQADGAPDPLLAAYPVRRPDGLWAILLLNKDPHQSRMVQISFDDSGKASLLHGPIDIWRYSGEQYAWKADGENGHPIRNLPPTHETLRATDAAGDAPAITLPPYSVCVVRGAR